MSLKKVFEPIRIGTVEIPNRVVRTAHGTGFGRAGLNEQFIGYHRARAEGGCGLTILEASSVHRSSQLDMWIDDDSIIPGYKKLMAAVRPFGMRVFQQLWHGGHHYYGHGGTIPWSASDLASPNIGVVPLPMTKAQIEELIAAFAATAVRCREGGLDGVELHAAHGYIFHQFLSPLSNRREDEYGGPLENRMRLLLETVRAVRRAVGADYPVGLRVSASEAIGSLKEDEIIVVIQTLQNEGLIDFVDASLGDYYRMDSMLSAMHSPAGYELRSSALLTAAAKVPRIVAGRFRTLEEVEQVLREGSADLVSMVRAQIADPWLVRKTREGRVDEVRPCLGCNQGCVGGGARTGFMQCTVNPAVGLEDSLDEKLITRAEQSLQVLVVGGGPAGMEAARIAALRGHRVTLAEAGSDLGGTVNVARRAPRLNGLGDITDWLEREVYRLGVEVRLGTYMDADAILAENADRVILATGSVPRMDGVQIANPGEPPHGVELPHVVSSIDLLTDPQRKLGTTALILDDTGHYEAIAAAEYLIEKGVAVTFVTRHAMFAPQAMMFMRALPALERLHKGNFELLTLHCLAEIRPQECLIRPLQSRKMRTVPADTVVLVTPNAPLRELYEPLRARLPGVHLIGDALTPRDVQFAIAEGHRTARLMV